MPRGLTVSAPAFLEIAGEAWLCVVQDADGSEETELITSSGLATAPRR
jgi:hypothetical protein